MPLGVPEGKEKEVEISLKEIMAENFPKFWGEIWISEFIKLIHHLKISMQNILQQDRLQ